MFSQQNMFTHVNDPYVDYELDRGGRVLETATGMLR